MAASQEGFSEAVTRIGTAGRNGHINFYGGFLNGAIGTVNGSFAMSPVGMAMSSQGWNNQIPSVGIAGNYDEQRWSSYAGSGSFFVASVLGPASTGGAASAASNAAFGSGSRVFWQGGDVAKVAAGQYATRTGGLTLEQTGIGIGLDKLTTLTSYSLTRPLWNLASRSFAHGGGQRADVIVGNSLGGQARFTNSTFMRVEWPVLQGAGKEVIFHAAG